MMTHTDSAESRRFRLLIAAVGRHPVGRLGRPEGVAAVRLGDAGRPWASPWRERP